MIAQPAQGVEWTNLFDRIFIGKIELELVVCTATRL